MTNCPMGPALTSCRALRVVYTNSVHNEPSVLTMEPLLRNVGYSVQPSCDFILYDTSHNLC